MNLDNTSIDNAKRTVRRLPTVSTTELTTFRRCQREHHIRYTLGITSAVKAHALRFGTLVHRGLEAWWLAAMRTAGDELLAAAFDAMTPRDGDGDLDAYDLARARAMLTGYHVRWVDEPLDVLGVEVPFVAPVRVPGTRNVSTTAMLGGKVDAVARDRNTGRVYVVEHKSASGDITPGSTYWKRLRMDPQVSIYGFGVRALAPFLKFDPDAYAGCLYDVLGKPGIEPQTATPEDKRRAVGVDAAARKWAEQLFARKWADLEPEHHAHLLADPSRFRLAANQRADDETADAYEARLGALIAEDPARWYVRGEVVRLEDDERDAEFDLYAQVRTMREAQRAKRAPRNPDACLRYGSECDFFRVCSREASLDDRTKFVARERHAIAMPTASTIDTSTIDSATG